MGCNPFLEKIWELEEEIELENGYKEAHSCGTCKFSGEWDMDYSSVCSLLTSLLESKLRDNGIGIGFKFRVNMENICRFYKERIK